MDEEGQSDDETVEFEIEVVTSSSSCSLVGDSSADVKCGGNLEEQTKPECWTLVDVARSIEPSQRVERVDKEKDCGDLDGQRAPDVSEPAELKSDCPPATCEVQAPDDGDQSNTLELLEEKPTCLQERIQSNDEQLEVTGQPAVPGEAGHDGAERSDDLVASERSDQQQLIPKVELDKLDDTSENDNENENKSAQPAGHTRSNLGPADDGYDHSSYPPGGDSIGAASDIYVPSDDLREEREEAQAQAEEDKAKVEADDGTRQTATTHREPIQRDDLDDVPACGNEKTSAQQISEPDNLNVSENQAIEVAHSSGDHVQQMATGLEPVESKLLNERIEFDSAGWRLVEDPAELRLDRVNESANRLSAQPAQTIGQRDCEKWPASSHDEPSAGLEAESGLSLASDKIPLDSTRLENECRSPDGRAEIELVQHQLEVDTSCNLAAAREPTVASAVAPQVVLEPIGTVEANEAEASELDSGASHSPLSFGLPTLSERDDLEDEPGEEQYDDDYELELERELELEEADFEPRQVLVKRNVDPRDWYELGTELGRGKFGTVFRCCELASGRHLAAKFINMRRREDREDVEREVAIMCVLQHKRLLQLYDAFDDGKQEMCLITELVEGGELFERIVDDDFDLTERKAAIFMRQICEGVDYMHSQNIVHLDMKPENILCMSRTGIRIKLIDFGLARRLDPNKPTRVMFGTPDFAAPEVLGYETVSLATDMWSVGVICYVLLSGLSPFMGENDLDTMANVTRATYDFNDSAFEPISELSKDFIAKLLLRNPVERLKPAECLRHPWLQRPPMQQATPSPPPLSAAASDVERRKSSLSAQVLAAGQWARYMDSWPLGMAALQRHRASFGGESTASSGLISLDKRRLKRYVVKRKWQKTVHAIMALNRMGAKLNKLVE